MTVPKGHSNSNSSLLKYKLHISRLDFQQNLIIHGGFLEGVYKIELDTKTEYEGF